MGDGREEKGNDRGSGKHAEEALEVKRMYRRRARNGEVGR
jgi:hypothetical protein